MKHHLLPLCSLLVYIQLHLLRNNCIDTSQKYLGARKPAPELQAVLSWLTRHVAFGFHTCGRAVFLFCCTSGDINSSFRPCLNLALRETNVSSHADSNWKIVHT